MTELNGTEYRDLVITGLVVLALGVSVLWWVADKLNTQDIEKRYPVHYEDNLAELDGFAAVRDGHSQDIIDIRERA